MPQQFVVPQFLDIESKIFGPITMRQFVIILIACFTEFVVYKLSDFTLFLVISVFVVALTGIIAFGKVQGAPIHEFLLNFIQSSKNARIQIWDKSLSDSEISQLIKKVPEKVLEVELTRKSPVGGSHLAELSLVVDTGGVYGGENVLNPLGKKLKTKGN